MYHGNRKRNDNENDTDSLVLLDEYFMIKKYINQKTKAIQKIIHKSDCNDSKCRFLIKSNDKFLYN